MSDWQKILRDESISTLDELKSYVTERFGAEAAEREIDVEALKPAFDNFQMRITRESLSQIKEVVPHFNVNPAIIGGVVVRVGDTVLDGSVRRRLSTLRAKMMGNRG